MWTYSSESMSCCVTDRPSVAAVRGTSSWRLWVCGAARAVEARARAAVVDVKRIMEVTSKGSLMKMEKKCLVLESRD